MIRFFYGDRDWELMFLGDESLKEIVEGISFCNAKRYFGI
jgi:hypothetical protein